MGGGVFKSIGKVFKSVAKVVKKVAKVAVPIALAYYTGGTSAALMSAGSNVLSGALSKEPKMSNAVTGQVAGPSTAADTAAADNSAAAAAAENQRRLALNAAGNGEDNSNPLGVTSKAKVSRRKLLGS